MIEITKHNGNSKFHINSVSFQLTWSIFLGFYQNKIIDDKSKDGALWSILCSILPYMLRIKKKTMKDIELFNQFFLNQFKFLWKHLFCLMMHLLNYCLFIYLRHNLYKRQTFSNTTTCRCKLCNIDFFNMFFYQSSIIWIQLTFYFINFIIGWCILGSTFFIKKPLYIQWY